MMSLLIIIFGISMLLAGVALIANPEIVFKVLQDNSDKFWLQIGAIVVRLILGILLVLQASVSKLPVTIEFIGWVAIFAALVFTVIGRNKFKRLISWAFSLFKPFGRMGGVLALSFGSFLIYAFT